VGNNFIKFILSGQIVRENYLKVNEINNYKYSKLRDKNYFHENNFGGVYYIFLSGINSQTDKNRGVYFDRPNETLLRQLEKYFENV
jgi:ligand-binding sensor protein